MAKKDSKKDGTRNLKDISKNYLEGMTKSDIKDMAAEEFNIELSTSDLKDEMIEQLLTEAAKEQIKGLTKAELKEYAYDEHGIRLSTSNKKKEMKENFVTDVVGGREPLRHALIPPHRKLDEEEKEEVYEEFEVSTKEMPKIAVNDPAIRHMDLEEGDIIEIERPSPTAGTTKFYRSVVRE